MFGFEKLEVWQLAIEFADRIYAVTRSFPHDERFGLISQMRRAAVSISSNIAEGNSRSSGPDFARFIEIAYGLLMELVSQTHVARRQNMIGEELCKEIFKRAEQLARMLSGLRKSTTGPPEHTT